jgi:3-oxoadipate enol-lactonase
MPIVRANGIDLYYEATGSGPPLLLLNGIGGNTEGLAWLLPALTDRFRVIGFDARGAGRSSIGVARAHVFGLSFGGMIAQELALAHPERVDHLVLVATNARCRPAFWEAWGTFFVQVKERGLDRAGVTLWFLAWMFTPAFMTQHDQVEATLAKWLDAPYPAPAHGIAAQMAAGRAHDTRERLPQIAAPTLVVVGAEDILTPVDDARELAEGIPGARLRILPGGGHLALAECNEAFLDALLAFLAT